MERAVVGINQFRTGPFVTFGHQTAVAALGNNGQFYVVHGIDTQRIAVDAIITLGYQRAGSCQFGPVIEKDAVAIAT